MKRALALSAALGLFASTALAQSVGPPIGPSSGNGGGGGGGGGSVTLNSVCPTGTQTGSTLTLNGQASIEATNVSGAITVATTDCGQVVAFNKAAGTAITWPVTGTLPQGYVVTLSNVGASGSGTVTAAAGGSVNGSATLTIAPNTAVTLFATDANGIVLQTMNASVASVTPAGSSGDFQTNNGAGGLGAVTPGTGVNTAFQAATNANGGLVSQNGAITTGDLISKSSTGAQDAATVVSGTPSSTLTSLQFHPGYVSSNWYTGFGAYTAAAGAATVANTIYCSAISIPSQGVVVKTLGLNATSNTNATHGGAAIYKTDGTSGRPGTLVDFAAPWTFAGSSATFSGALNGTTDTLKGGAYWLCGSSDSTPTYLSWSALGSGGTQMIGGTLAQVVVSSSIINGLVCTADGTTGAGKCGSGQAAWSAGALTWASLSAAQWTNITTATTPVIAFQVN